MKNKDKILTTLEEGPKKYIDLKKETGLENGVLQHHIRANKKIVKRADAVMLKNECSKCVFDKCGSCIKAKMQKPKKRKIANKVDKGKTQVQIAKELNLSKATINHHVQDLRKSNILKNGRIRNKLEIKQE